MAMRLRNNSWKDLTRNMRTFLIIIILPLLLLEQCVLTSDSAMPEEDSGGQEAPFIPRTRGIEMGAPEQEEYYTADGIRINWATAAIHYHIVFIMSSNPELDTGTSYSSYSAYSLKSKENIVARWDTSLGESNLSSTGYIGPDILRWAVQGEAVTASFSFTSGTYYALILGYDEHGELTHSSAVRKFFIY
jgi:hypothetical protein